MGGVAGVLGASDIGGRIGRARTWGTRRPRQSAIKARHPRVWCDATPAPLLQCIVEFVQLTLDWCRGEIFEGTLAAIFGLVVATGAFLFWKLGDTPYSKALFVPMLIVGLLYLAAGIGLVIVNNERIAEFPEQYARSPAEFVTAETARVDCRLSDAVRISMTPPCVASSSRRTEPRRHCVGS